MGLLLIIIIIGVGIWFAHVKLGYKLGSIFLVLFSAISAIIIWAEKTTHDNKVKTKENFSKTYNASKAQLYEWATQDEDEELQKSAIFQLRQRYGVDWRDRF